MQAGRFKVTATQAVVLGIAAGTFLVLAVLTSMHKLDKATFLLLTSTLGVLPMLAADRSGSRCCKRSSRLPGEFAESSQG